MLVTSHEPRKIKKKEKKRKKTRQSHEHTKITLTFANLNSLNQRNIIHANRLNTKETLSKEPNQFASASIKMLRHFLTQELELHTYKRVNSNE